MYEGTIKNHFSLAFYGYSYYCQDYLNNPFFTLRRVVVALTSYLETSRKKLLRAEKKWTVLLAIMCVHSHLHVLFFSRVQVFLFVFNSLDIFFPECR